MCSQIALMIEALTLPSQTFPPPKSRFIPTTQKASLHGKIVNVSAIILWSSNCPFHFKPDPSYP